MALEEWKLRLTSAKVEVEAEAELGNIFSLKLSICSETCKKRIKFFPQL